MKCYHSKTDANPWIVEDNLMGYYMTPDSFANEPADQVTRVSILSRGFNDMDEALDACHRASYGSTTAYYAIVAPTGAKVSKTFQKAWQTYKERLAEYRKMQKEMSMAYGKKSQFIGCPKCHSKIARAYAQKVTCCPVCGTPDVISQTNRKKLHSKRDAVAKSGAAVAKAGASAGIFFAGGVQWHE